MFGLGKKLTIADLPAPSLSELKKRTKILVIDDDENSFPFELLRREGYSIEHWPRVESLMALEEGQYDVIILDIQGVAKHISQDDGLGVLDLIKKTSPSQIVVAFSSHSFDLSKTRFWKMADDSLCKPVDAATCKRLIDNLIETKRTPHHYWSAIVDLLNSQGASPKQVAKTEDKVVRALRRKDASGLSEVLKHSLDNADIGVKAIGIGCKIVALLGL